LLARICREEQLTPIVSLHQLAFARRYAQRIVGLAAGRVVFDGRPESLDEEHLRAIYGDNSPESPDAPASLPRSPAPLEERPDDKARILA
jgi:phosphonate transport system ATP-binding protein